MIPKSGYRFSDKIMCKLKIYLNVIQLSRQARAARSAVDDSGDLSPCK
jgi:hypothetical protein